MPDLFIVCSDPFGTGVPAWGEVRGESVHWRDVQPAGESRVDGLRGTLYTTEDRASTAYLRLLLLAATDLVESVPMPTTVPVVEPSRPMYCGPASAEDVQICAKILGRFPGADDLTLRHTARTTLLGLVVNEGGDPSYRPTLDVCDHPELVELADAYDAAQKARGNALRARRIGCLRVGCPRCGGLQTDIPVRRRKGATAAASETSE